MTQIENKEHSDIPKSPAELVQLQCDELVIKYSKEKDKSDLISRLAPKIIESYKNDPKLQVIHDQNGLEKFFDKNLNDENQFNKLLFAEEDLS